MSSLPADPARLLSDLDFVRSLARSLCRDHSQAEDLAQETMVRALQHGPRESGHRRGWLATVTRNLFRNHVRDEHRRLRREADRPLDATVPSSAEIHAREELRRQVVCAVTELPEHYRAVILMRHYRGLSTAQCAEQLGLNESTVRTRMQRGLERLRERLDERHGGDRKAWSVGLAAMALPASTAAVPVATGTRTALFAIAAVAATVALAVALIEPWGPTRPPAAGEPVAPVAAAELATTAVVDPSEATTQPAERTVASAPVPVVRGELRGDDGRPVADADVRLSRYRGWRHAGELLGRARSDGDGAFAIPLTFLSEWSPLARQYFMVELRVRADGYYASPEQAHLTQANGYRPEPVMFIMDEHRGPPVPVWRLQLSSKPHVTGRVVDRHGQPVADARVGFAAASHAVDTDLDGHFELIAPASGPDTLVVVHPEHGCLLRDATEPGALGELTIDAPLHRIEGVARLPDGAVAAGRRVRIVRLPPAGSRSRFPTGSAALRGRVVRLYHTRFGGGHGTWTVPVRADGTFACAAATPGPYTLGVTVEQRLDDRGAPSTDTRVEVDAAREVEHVELSCARVVLNADVRDRDDRPVQIGVIDLYAWPPSTAAAAQSRFAAVGIEALDEAPIRVTRPLATFVGFEVAPGGFQVVRVQVPGCAAAMQAVPLDEQRFEQELSFRIARPASSGAMQLVLRRDGEAFDGLAAFKLKPARPRDAAPLELPTLPQLEGPHLHIGGPWHLVPASGLAEHVPAGDWVVEVAIDVTRGTFGIANGPITATRADVTVQAGATTSVEVGGHTGIPVEFATMLSPSARHLRLRHAEATVERAVPQDGGAVRWQAVADVDATVRHHLATVRWNAPPAHDGDTVRVRLLLHVERRGEDPETGAQTWHADGTLPIVEREFVVEQGMKAVRHVARPR